MASLDVHKEFSKGVLLTAEAEVEKEAEISHYRTREELGAFLEGLEKGGPVVLEATFNWPWMADLIEDLGYCPRLVNQRVARERLKDRGKNDRKDAEGNGLLFLSGRLFPECYLAPREVRQKRDLFRARLLLVRMRGRLKNTVHGQLHRAGVLLEEAEDEKEPSDLFSAKGRALLAQVELNEHERHELERKLAVLDDLQRHIDRAEKELKGKLKQDERAKYLLSIPGVGELTAYTLLAEIGDISRFPNGRALADYAGALPVPNESAGKQFEIHTSPRCDRYLRWAVLEGVTGAVMSSPRMRSLYERVKSRNGGKKKKARMAVAREILELAHLVLSRKVMYLENPPPRPGSRKGGRRNKPAAREERKG